MLVTFGKYSGQSFGNIWNSDRRYTSWIRSSELRETSPRNFRLFRSFCVAMEGLASGNLFVFGPEPISPLDFMSLGALQRRLIPVKLAMEFYHLSNASLEVFRLACCFLFVLDSSFNPVLESILLEVSAERVFCSVIRPIRECMSQDPTRNDSFSYVFHRIQILESSLGTRNPQSS